MQRQEPRFEHLLWAVGGALVGAWWMKNRDDEAKKSRAERGDPEGVREVCEDIAEVLDEREPSDECKSEDGFVHDLADWLSENVDWELEIQPGTREGQPDILVGDLLALELKVNPTKSEQDRCVGQSAGYSREWVPEAPRASDELVPAFRTSGQGTDKSRLQDAMHLDVLCQFAELGFVERAPRVAFRLLDAIQAGLLDFHSHRTT